MTHEMVPVAPKLVESALHCSTNRGVNLQVSRPHTPNLEHEWDRVIANESQTERPHERDGSSPCPESLVGNLGDVGVCDSGTADDTKVGYTCEEYL